MKKTAKNNRQKKKKTISNLFLKAYKAQAVQGFKTFSGKKAGRMIAIGYVDFSCWPTLCRRNY